MPGPDCDKCADKCQKCQCGDKCKCGDSGCGEFAYANQKAVRRTVAYGVSLLWKVIVIGRVFVTSFADLNTQYFHFFIFDGYFAMIF